MGQENALPWRTVGRLVTQPHVFTARVSGSERARPVAGFQEIDEGFLGSLAE